MNRKHVSMNKAATVFIYSTPGGGPLQRQGLHYIYHRSATFIRTSLPSVARRLLRIQDDLGKHCL